MVKVFHSMEFDKLIGNIDVSRLGQKVGIKVHFGEKGCTTYVNPALVKQLCDWLTGLGKEPVLIECSVLYYVERTRASTHIKLAKEHGFDFAPIHILDGERGDEFVELDGCKIGKGIEDYDSLIVVTHFKGNRTTTFGGAIKNLGVGLASPAGKLHIHTPLSIAVVRYKCDGCEKCIETCPVAAISILNGKAWIDQKKCTRCAECMCVCPLRAIKPPYYHEAPEAILDNVRKRIRKYALAIIKHIGRDKVTFINVLEKMTTLCDCYSFEQKPIMPDKGYLLSNDIDAVELASLKLTKNLDGIASINVHVRVVDYEIVEL